MNVLNDFCVDCFKCEKNYDGVPGWGAHGGGHGFQQGFHWSVMRLSKIYVCMIVEIYK